MFSNEPNGFLFLNLSTGVPLMQDSLNLVCHGLHYSKCKLIQIFPEVSLCDKRRFFDACVFDPILMIILIFWRIFWDLHRNNNGLFPMC